MKSLADLANTVDNNDKRQKMNNNNFVNQLSGSESGLKRKIQDVERLSKKLNDDCMIYAKERFEYLELKQKNMNDEVDKNLLNVATKLDMVDTTETLMGMVKEAIQNQIDTQVKHLIFQAKRDMEIYVTNKFTIPELIGEKEKYKCYDDWAYYITDKIETVPVLLESKITQANESLANFISESKLNEESRTMENLQRANKFATELQQKSFEDLKANLDKILRSANLEVDTKCKTRIDNMKDNIDIQQQSFNKSVEDHQKLLQALQQKVYDLNDFKFKDLQVGFMLILHFTIIHCL